MQESIRHSILIFREGLDLKEPRVLLEIALGLRFPPLGFYFFLFLLLLLLQLLSLLLSNILMLMSVATKSQWVQEDSKVRTDN